MSAEQKRYHDDMYCNFADYHYEKMVSERYGIEFCCGTKEEKILQGGRYDIGMELLALNAVADPIVDGEVNGNPILPVVLECLSTRVSAAPKNGGTFTYVPCGETEAVLYVFNGLAAENKTFCYNPDTEPVITGGLLQTIPIACDGTQVCQERVYTVLNWVDGQFGPSWVHIIGTDCSGSPVDYRLEYDSFFGFVDSPPICLDLAELISVDGIRYLEDDPTPCT